MNKLPELKQIIADSKEGQNEVYILDGVPYYSTARTSPYRSLADIREMIQDKERIAELEKELSFLRKAYVKLLKEIKKQKEQGE